MVKLTNNELVILSLLIRKDMYGLELISTVEEEAGKVLKLGGLYNVMRRLEKKGFVESYWGEDSDARHGHRRRYYKITGLGKTAQVENQQVFGKLWGYNPGLAPGIV